MNNIIKARGDDDPNSLNNESNLRRGNKRGGRPYDKENNNKNEKIRITKPDKYHKERKKLKF